MYRGAEARTRFSIQLIRNLFETNLARFEEVRSTLPFVVNWNIILITGLEGPVINIDPTIRLIDRYGIWRFRHMEQAAGLSAALAVIVTLAVAWAKGYSLSLALGAALVLGLASFINAYVVLNHFDAIVDWYDERRLLFSIAEGIRGGLFAGFWFWFVLRSLAGASIVAVGVAVVVAVGTGLYGSRELDRLKRIKAGAAISERPSNA